MANITTALLAFGFMVWSSYFSHGSFSVTNVTIRLTEDTVASIYRLDNVNNNKTLEARINPSTSPSVFGINANNGQVFLLPTSTLDYENRKSWTLLIDTYAKNNPSILLEQTQLTILVIDENDVTPSFVPFWPLYPTAEAVAVLVGQTNTPPGTLVYKATAVDPDTTAKLVYSWSPGRDVDTQGRFQIASTTGAVTTVGVDPFPASTMYRLSIRVTDVNSLLPERGFADMKLLVYTDYQPVLFPLPVFTVTFPENAPVGTDVGPIPGRPINYEFDTLRYSILSQPADAVAPVSLADAATGRLVTRRIYDYDKLLDHSWPYVVQATENNTYTSTALMIVTLTDVDDNPPFFQLAIYESAPIAADVTIGTTVFELTPDDRDSVPEARSYTYSLIGGDASFFNVTNGHNGAATISTTGLLDYDKLPIRKKFLEFTLSAESPPGSATTLVRIKLKNVNRHPPTILSFGRLLVPRRFGFNKPFYKFITTDLDGGTANFFFLNSNNVTVSQLGPFSIDETTGNLMLISLPRIQIYPLTIKANDGGICQDCPPNGMTLWSAPFAFSVEVIEFNHYRPKFTKCPAIQTITELSPADTEFGEVTAIDDDDTSPDAPHLLYSIIPNTIMAHPEELIRINATTGKLSNVKALERSAGSLGGILPTEVYFTVRVQDWGTPILWSLCNFQLSITDVNNKPPVFDPTAYFAAVDSRKNYGSGTVVLQVVAIDEDEPNTERSRILYRLRVEHSMFFLNEETGELSVKQTVASQTINFIVEAINPVALVTSAAWNAATITVYVISEDNLVPPLISVSTITNQLPEDFGTSPIAVLTATPAPGATYTPHISLYHGAFEQTGWLNSPPPFSAVVNGLQLTVSSRRNFLYQRVQQYRLRVSACIFPNPNGYSSLCEERVFNFEIIDVNNMKPNFVDQNALQSATLLENTTAGSEVLRLYAVDTDTVPEYCKITYSLMPGDDSIHFAITNGVLVTRDEVFDNEGTKRYGIRIKAEDGAPSSLPESAPQNNSG